MSTDFAAWVGRTQRLEQRIDAHAVAALAATLDLPQAPGVGQDLPPGWHWLFFNPLAQQHQLGEDGHPRRDLPGSLLPPVPLPRRMWAGGRLRYHAPLQVGALATRTSTVTQIEPKEGRSGQMCFVTVAHELHQDGVCCISEAQDIVYREASPPLMAPTAAPTAGAVPPGAADTVPAGADASAGLAPRTLTPDAALLFRYSALTFNSHRIHYDLPYAQQVEGYPGLVMHGPLTATLLQGYACAQHPARQLAAFRFRGVGPLFARAPCTLQGWPDATTPDRLHLQASNALGRPAMQAEAEWHPTPSRSTP